MTVHEGPKQSNWAGAPWRPAPDVPRPPPPARGYPGWLHLVLFMLTVATTTVAGVGLVHRPAPLAMHVAFNLVRHDPRRLLDGIAFSAPLLCMLFAHEMGHYLVARRWHVKASWPFFVPLPAGLGTMGAVISMDSEDNRRERRALLEIGAAGPLVGFVVAFLFLLLGMSFSVIKTADEMRVFTRLGGLIMPDSPALALARWLVFGTLPPEREVVLHPMAMAGWYGLYLTWFNLLPFGQLDGGHLSFATQPARAVKVSVGVVVATLLLAAGTGSLAWLMLTGGLLLLGLLAGLAHPEPPPGPAPGTRQRAVLVACVAVFLLCFVGDPLPRSGL